jgi:branched-chain amino acid transport system ATP-binding protein
MLQVRNLDAGYGNLQILRDISLDLNEGEMVTIIGANGAGKTTLLMAICGVLRPKAGSISFLGTRIDEMQAHDIAKLGMLQVPQGRMLFPDMTVMENLELWYHQTERSKGKDIKVKLAEIFSYFEVLGRRKGQRAGTLSGGEQQMLAVARALMASPKLLILDEISFGLSPLLVENLGQIILDLHKSGLNILLVEQNAYLALELADRGYVMETGSIVASGTTAELAQSDMVKKSFLGA